MKVGSMQQYLLGLFYLSVCGEADAENPEATNKIRFVKV